MNERRSPSSALGAKFGGRVAPAIQVTNLTKSFGKLAVLQGVDFSVAPGEIFALLGANGAGKTTVVRILSTLARSDSGSAEVLGCDAARDPSGVRAAISLTGQSAAVDDALTARENIVLLARLRQLTRPRDIADQLLAQFSLTEAAHRKVSTFSGGMRRRLDIALGLVGDPPVMFLDEPTTGLDPESRRAVWATVKDLSARGTTVLLTTQYLDEAEHLADRIAILHAGRIIASGSLAELKALLPPVQKRYVEQQPTLEEIYLAITKNAPLAGADQAPSHGEDAS